MSAKAKRVAELIYCNATSGSGAWDELDGPEAVLTQVSDGPSIVTIASPEYDDNGDPIPGSGTVTVITVETVRKGTAEALRRVPPEAGMTSRAAG